MTRPTEFSYSPQGSRLYAIFDNPPAVFAGRVNQTFASTDKVIEFAYDGVTVGSYSAAKEGMTLLLGSAAGGHDLGIAFLRKAPDASKVYVGDTSEVAWADNAYFTVLATWDVWVEYPIVLANATELMHHDIQYSDQHSALDPVPVMGSDRVAFLTGASVTLAFNWSASWVIGSTITGYSCACAGATVTGGTTATPSIEFTSAGRYVIALTVTAANGKSRTGYRIAHIKDANNPPTPVIVSAISGSYERGGWEFGLDVPGDVSGLRPRTKVILFAEDYYGTTATSFGPLAGSENIVAIGWLENESVSEDAFGGQFQVNARGPHYWLNQLYNFVPPGLQSVSATPEAWTQIQALTVDKYLWHVLAWWTTIMFSTDVSLTGYVREASELSAQPGTLWDQIKSTAWQSLLALPCCDRYGRLFVEVEAALHPVSMRSGIPVTGEIDASKCESIGVQIVRVPPVAQVILAGMAVSGTTAQAIRALSRGHIPGRLGQPTIVDRLLLSSQALANEQAANLLERENVPYRFQFSGLLANDRRVDIAPRQYVDAVIASADNPRGIAYSGNVIVKEIELEIAEGGAWNITWGAVPETQAVLSQDGDTVQNDLVDGTVVSTTWKPPAIPPIPSVPPLPVINPGLPPSGCGYYAPANSYPLTWSRSTLKGSDTVRTAQAYFPCVLRPTSYYNGGSVLVISTLYAPGSRGKLHVYGIDGSGNRIITGIVTTPPSDSSATTVIFDPAGEVTVAGFEAEIEAGETANVPGGAAEISIVDTSVWDDLYPGASATHTATASQVNSNVCKLQVDWTIHDPYVSSRLGVSVKFNTNVATTIYYYLYFLPNGEHEEWTSQNPPYGPYKIDQYYRYLASVGGGDTGYCGLAFLTQDIGPRYGDFGGRIVVYFCSFDSLLVVTNQVTLSGAWLYNVCGA